MNTDKMKQAAFETAIENENELFSNKDTTNLAMSAALVACQLQEELARIVQVISFTALEAASEVDGPREWTDLFTSKLDKGGEMTKMLSGLAFVMRYTEGLAKVAALRSMKSDSAEDQPAADSSTIKASFGRN